MDYKTQFFRSPEEGRTAGLRGGEGEKVLAESWELALGEVGQVSIGFGARCGDLSTSPSIEEGDMSRYESIFALERWLHEEEKRGECLRRDLFLCFGFLSAMLGLSLARRREEESGGVPRRKRGTAILFGGFPDGWSRGGESPG